MVEISLDNARWRWGLVLLSLVIAAILIPEACVLWVAHYRITSDNLDLMERGVKLTPGDAAGWDRVGHLQQWDFLNPNLPAAIADYQKAVREEPHSANYWMDLAGAYEAAGDANRAHDAFARAKAVYPASAVVAFNYGNFLLRDEKPQEGFAELRHAISADRDLLPLAISRSWKATRDVNQLLNDLLPANTEAYAQAVNFFASSGVPEAAMAAWQGLIALHQPFDLPRAFPFIDQLIRGDRGDDARAVWLEALAAASLPYDPPANTSLIWNGDFAMNFANGGLDWRWTDLLGADFSFDSAPGGGKSRAVRIDFSGGINLELGLPAQYVPVESGRTYHFHALMRTDGITTESGMQFLVTDPNHSNAVVVTTENFTGSREWTPVEADVVTGPKTHLLLVQLTRKPSRLFENRLGGTVWIADLTLVPSSTSKIQNGRPTE
jgi:tetratricopeptide (TPR) repeat protein